MNTIPECLKVGNTVFFTFAEEFWPYPFVQKRSHVAPVKTVILQGEVTEIHGNEFKAKLFENNGFEKDGEIGRFNVGNLLSNQDYKDKQLLGIWNQPELVDL